MNAYYSHYPIRIKPDDIWLLIVQCFSNHVNENSEKLRNSFLNLMEKTLKMKIDTKGLDIGKKHLEIFIEEINKRIGREFRKRT